jgi:hypothetical protein
MPRELRFSDLSAARQALVRLCQSTNYGHIQDLEVRDREPILSNPQCVVSLEIKLDAEDRPLQTSTEPDFLL